MALSPPGLAVTFVGGSGPTTSYLAVPIGGHMAAGIGVCETPELLRMRNARTKFESACFGMVQTSGPAMGGVLVCDTISRTKISTAFSVSATSAMCQQPEAVVRIMSSAQLAPF